MTGVTRWNKAVTMAGADGWNLSTDEGKALDTANVIVPVASQAERDGLTPPGGKYAGMTVARNDILGEPLEVWDGAAWHRQGPKVIPSASSIVGAALAATAFTSGAFTPMFQGGTIVATTDASGYLGISYPQAFPNGVLGLSFTNGDSGSGRTLILSVAGSPFTQTLATGYCSVVTAAGAPVVSSSVRVTYLAWGW